MQFQTNRKFDKRYLKLNSKIQNKFKERRDLFGREPNSKILNIHKLSGKYEGAWSINITGEPVISVANQGEKDDLEQKIPVLCG